MMQSVTNRVFEGDCREVLREFPNELIAACITDPPYNYEFIGHKWDDQEVKRRMERVRAPESKTMVKNIPYGSGLAGGVRNARWYRRNRENILEYREWCYSWAQELFRVCKAGAPVAVFNSSRTAAHVQIALEDAGFYARDLLVFRRNSGIPKGLNVERKMRQKGREDAEDWKGWHSCFRNEWEAIVLVQKPLYRNYLQTLDETGVGVFKTINSDGSFQSNILEGFHQKGKNEEFSHCTVKPLKLLRKLVATLVPTEGSHLVLDPFAGSGTTLVAAAELGIDYVGIEIEPSYLPIIHERIAALEEKSKRLTLF
ncbi:MAG: site-specific DNA-methyltransferase [Bacteroidota bacterium]